MKSEQSVRITFQQTIYTWNNHEELGSRKGISIKESGSSCMDGGDPWPGQATQEGLRGKVDDDKSSKPKVQMNPRDGRHKA